MCKTPNLSSFGEFDFKSLLSNLYFSIIKGSFLLVRQIIFIEKEHKLCNFKTQKGWFYKSVHLKHVFIPHLKYDKEHD